MATSTLMEYVYASVFEKTSSDSLVLLMSTPTNDADRGHYDNERVCAPTRKKIPVDKKATKISKDGH